MRDRIPAPGRENRIRITQDDGTVIAGKLEYDDQATQEGSPYTKGNVLPDEVCTALGLAAEESEPRDGFRYMSLIQADVYGEIVIYVKYTTGIPAEGILFYIDGQSFTTDAKGRAAGKFSSGQHTVIFNGTLDMEFSPATFSAAAAKGQSRAYNVTCSQSENTEIAISSSQKIAFSNRVESFDAFLVGAGGAGAAVSSNNRGSVGSLCASGGAGGYTATIKNIVPTGQDIVVNIGSGGRSETSSNDEGGGEGIDGLNGGDTTITMGGSLIGTAKGGAGGRQRWHTSQDYTESVNGADGGSGSGSVQTTDPIAAGASGSNGSSGNPGGTGQGRTTTKFEEGTGTQYSPAGGSCGGRKASRSMVGSGTVGVGGANAVARVTSNTNDAVSGNRATVPGGGGGAALLIWQESSYATKTQITTGAGANGLAIIRWRYKT